jgi:hypothetical protein
MMDFLSLMSREIAVIRHQNHLNHHILDLLQRYYQDGLDIGLKTEQDHLSEEIQPMMGVS